MWKLIICLGLNCSILNCLNLGLQNPMVNHFKQAVVMADGITNILESHITDNSVTTFVADNVDHKIATLDGHGTFHGMGVIAVTTNMGLSISGAQYILNQRNMFRSLLLKRKESLLHCTIFPLIMV